MLTANEAVQRWVRQEEVLVGCPSKDHAKSLNGSIVGIVDGFYILSLTDSDRLKLTNSANK